MVDFVALMRAEKAKYHNNKRSPKRLHTEESNTPMAQVVPAAPAWQLAESPLRKQVDRPQPDVVGASALKELRYAGDFISSEEEASLLAAFEVDESWVRLRGRSLLRFGGAAGSVDFEPEPLPAIIGSVADAVSRVIGLPLDHCLVNSYTPCQGIMAHTDGPAYEHITATLSCGQDRLVHFERRLRPGDVGTARHQRPVASVLLRRRSLLVFSGEAYINHTHAIWENEADVVDDRCVNAAPGDHIPVRARRLSFTLRRAKRTALHEDVV